MRTALVLALAIGLMVVGVVGADDAIKPDDEGFICNWLVLAPLPFGSGQSGVEALAKEQVPGEAKLRPKEGDKVTIRSCRPLSKDKHFEIVFG